MIYVELTKQVDRYTHVGLNAQVMFRQYSFLIGAKDDTALAGIQRYLDKSPLKWEREAALRFISELQVK